MKKMFIFLVIFLSASTCLPAQKLMKVVYVKDGAITKNPKEANWLIAIRSVNSRYERNDYKMNGPLKRVKTFKDLEQTVLDGHYLEYDDGGNLSLAGRYTDNKKTGRWYWYNDSGKVIRTEKYEGPGLFDDSSKHFTTKGDSLIPPSFKGGKKEWRDYIHSNLNNEVATNPLKDEKVSIMFTVTETGSVKNCFLTKSEYFAFDQEVFRLINKMPLWKPATFGGVPIEYRYNQSITLMDVF